MTKTESDLESELNLKVLENNVYKMLEVLEFYANPDTYFAIGLFPNPRCGEFINDINETKFGIKPGKMARDLIENMLKEFEELQKSNHKKGEK